MHPAAWLVPRHVAEKAGPWNESLSLNDDGEYFARVALAAEQIAFTADPAAAVHYRSQLKGSLSGSRSRTAMDSLFRSGELMQHHILAREDSSRIRQALADNWRYLSFELYPSAPELSREAEKRSAMLGGSAITAPLGRRAAFVARVLGWRLAKRIALALPR